MKNIQKVVLLILTISVMNLVPVKGVFAQEERKQAVNVCAIAIPVMKLYVLNYEYLYHLRHGLAIRAEYASDLSGESASGTGVAAVLNYRWHFSPKLANFFIGPYARYRYVSGSGNTTEYTYDFKIPELNIGLNGGYRWVSKIGFNVVLAGGYGYSWSSEKLTPSNDQVITKFKAFKKANDTNKAYIDAPFYGEVSIGYAF